MSPLYNEMAPPPRRPKSIKVETVVLIDLGEVRELNPNFDISNPGLAADVPELSLLAGLKMIGDLNFAKIYWTSTLVGNSVILCAVNGVLIRGRSTQGFRHQRTRNCDFRKCGSDKDVVKDNGSEH